MRSQHMYCGRVWNLIQACDEQSSHKVGNFKMKIYYPTGDRTPDLLNQRQTCYHLSQRGKPISISKFKKAQTQNVFKLKILNSN